MKKISFKKLLIIFLVPYFNFLNLLEFFNKSRTLPQTAGYSDKVRDKKNKPTAIVIFYLGNLGDIVCLSPMFKAIKKSYPDDKLIFIARQPLTDILANNPYINQIINFTSYGDLQKIAWLIKIFKELKKYKIKYFFNLTAYSFEVGILGLGLRAQKRFMVATHQDGLSQKILYPFYQTKKYNPEQMAKEFVFDILSQAKIKVEDKKNQLFFKEQKLPEVDKFFKENNVSHDNIIIGVSAGSGKDFKLWPNEYWQKLVIQLMQKYQAKIIFFGTSPEKDKTENIRRQIPYPTYSLFDLKLNQLPYYLKRCNLFVSVDTGPLYIADALGVPVVDILGPCDEKTQRPENNYRLVTNRQYCRPLSKIFIIADKKDFPEMINCFKSITPEQVLVACQELLTI